MFTSRRLVDEAMIMKARIHDDMTLGRVLLGIVRTVSLVCSSGALHIFLLLLCNMLLHGRFLSFSSNHVILFKAIAMGRPHILDQIFLSFLSASTGRVEQCHHYSCELGKVDK